MSQRKAILLTAPLLYLLLASNFYIMDPAFLPQSDNTFNGKGEIVSVLTGSQVSIGNGELKVVGKGYYTEINGEMISFDINASEKKSGSINGHIKFKSPFLEFRGNVDCMNLVQGKLIVSGTMRQISKGSIDWVFVGIRYQFTFEDNSDNTDMSSDRMSSVSIGGPADCVSAINLATPNEIKGNIQIIR
jgi:hypothetical protein